MSIMQPAIRLAELEVVIERGLYAYIESGKALREVRDARLYREHYATFEEYCNERWTLTRQHVNRCIEASTVVLEVLEPMGSIPKTERIARELVTLKGEPEKLRDAWSLAQQEPVITATVAAKAVSAVRTPVIVQSTTYSVSREAQESSERRAAVALVRVNDSEIETEIAEQLTARQASLVFDELSDACVLFANMKSPIEFISSLPQPITEYPIHHFRIALEWLSEFLEVVK